MQIRALAVFRMPFRSYDIEASSQSPNRYLNALTLSFYYKKEEGVAGQERCSECCSGAIYFVPEVLFRNKRPEQGRNGGRNR